MGDREIFESHGMLELKNTATYAAGGTVTCSWPCCVEPFADSQFGDKVAKFGTSIQGSAACAGKDHVRRLALQSLLYIILI